MNGTKTTIALSVLLGTLTGGVAMADLLTAPKPPHLILSCGQPSYFGSKSLEPSWRRVKRIMSSPPSENIAQMERLWFRTAAPIVDAHEEWQLDCIMMKAGFTGKDEGPERIVYRMYREQFPFNPEIYAFSFSNDDGGLKLERVTIDSGMS